MKTCFWSKVRQFREPDPHLLVNFEPNSGSTRHQQPGVRFRGSARDEGTSNRLPGSRRGTRDCGYRHNAGPSYGLALGDSRGQDSATLRVGLAVPARAPQPPATILAIRPAEGTTDERKDPSAGLSERTRSSVGLGGTRVACLNESVTTRRTEGEGQGWWVCI